MALDYTAATIRSQAGQIASRPLFMDNIEVPGDASYATGGYSLDTFAESLMQQTRNVKNVVGHGTNGSTMVVVRWNATTGKMLVVSATTGVEVANATNLSGYTFFLMLISE